MSGHNSYQARQRSRAQRHAGIESTLKDTRRRMERRAETAREASNGGYPYQDTPANADELLARLRPCPGCGHETTYPVCAECAGGGDGA